MAALESYETIEGGRAPAGPNVYPARFQRRWIVGCDLGQSSDPTAIAVIEHVKAPSPRWKVTERERQAPIKRQEIDERFDVRHLQRLPLGMSYPAVAAAVGDLLQRPPLNGEATLVIDSTGVGRAVADIFRDAGLKFIGITITAGAEATAHRRDEFHVPKAVLVSTLDARLHTGECRFAADLAEAEAMRDELKDFRRHVGAAGRHTYEARVGKHDDLVLATAIALWWACRPVPVVRFGRYSLPVYCA